MLEEKLKEDLKNALKSGDKVRLSAIRMVMSDIKNRKIEKITDKLDDPEIISLIQKMARRHRESIDGFRSGGREDLVSKESEELAIIEEYIPQPLSDEELSKIVDEAVSSTGASSIKDMGAVMKEAARLAAGRADGRALSEKVKARLGGAG